MMFTINDSSTIWIPIFIINEPFDYTRFCLLLVQFGLLLTSLWISLHTAHRVLNSIFHPNMKLMISSCLISYFVFFLGRLFFYPYVVGFVSVPGVDGVLQLIWTDDISKIPRISTLSEVSFIFLGSVFVWFYMAFIVTTVLAVSLERTFSNILIDDYEIVQRTWIFWSSFGAQILISCTIAWFIVFNCFSFYVTLMLGMGFSSVGVFIFLVNRFYTSQIVQRLETHTNYSLAQKFQTIENVRVGHMILKVFIYIVGLIVFTLSWVIVSYIDWWPKLQYLFMFFAETMIISHNLVICPIILVSLSKENANRKTAPIFYDVPKETEQYFDQLKSSWK